MIHALFLAAIRLNTAETFIEESRQAVAALDNGEWRLEFEETGGQAGSAAKTPHFEAMVLRRGHDSLMETKLDGTRVLEASVIGSKALYVDYQSGRFIEDVVKPWEEVVRETQSDEKVTENEFRYFLTPERGFQFLVDPPMQEARVARDGTTEILTTKLVHRDGTSGGTFRYERDAKTKLPKLARLVTKESDVTFSLRFKVRAVRTEELTIPASHYASLKKVDSP